MADAIAMLADMSIHCAETEYDTLLDAIDALEAEHTPHVATAAAALAERYLMNIGDLSATQRALLRATLALYAHGDAEESCATALAAFSAILRKLRRGKLVSY
jgi:hypothetical protein